MTGILSTLLVLLVAAPNADVSRAKRLYEKARYEKALKTLGPTCEGVADRVDCERLRGFILMAVGRDDKARAAFERMLAIDPASSLGPDASPKLRELFSGARQQIDELGNLELEPVELESRGAMWVLRVAPPLHSQPAKITAFVAAGSELGFQQVELVLEGSRYVGSFDAEVPTKGIASYYLVSTLPTGVVVPSGSETDPNKVSVTVGTDGSAGGGGSIYTGSGRGRSDDGDAPDDGTGDGNSDSYGAGFDDTYGAGRDDDDGLPQWAIWSMVGGGVAVVITVLVVALSGGSGGDIEVNVAFGDQ